MKNIIEFNDYLRKKNKKHKYTSFSKAEMEKIMSIYSKNVAAGIWKDYAITFADNLAVFSIFKRSSEKPIYSIAKIAGKSADKAKFRITLSQKVLKNCKSMEEVVKVFKNPDFLKPLRIKL
jgi:hypothetical protein